MPGKLEHICAALARVAARLIRRGIQCAVQHGPGWYVFHAQTGDVPIDVLRAMMPGVRPGLPAATPDEKLALKFLAAGPLTGAEWAAALVMEATGGGFARRVRGLCDRGFVTNPDKGYRLTEYGAWALGQG
jgi:hypothetical protein